MNNFRKCRILLFTTGFAPYSFSENLVNSKLALALQNSCGAVDIISAVDEGPVYSASWNDPWLQLQENTHEIVNQRGSSLSLLVTRCRDSMAMGYPLPHIRWARQALEKGLELHRATPYDLVISRSISCVSHLPALSFCKKTGVPWIANWNDPPSFLFPAPYHIPANWWWKAVWSRYYRAVARAATCNTFPSLRLAQYMQKHLGCFSPEKTEIIPHLMLEGYEPGGKPESSVFRLCHAGNLSPERNPIPFLTALRRLIDTDAKGMAVEFEIIGVENDQLKQQIAQLQLQNHVRCQGAMSYLETMKRLALSTVPVLIEAPCEEGIFLPSKFIDYVQARRPILAVSPGRGTITDILTRYGGGLAVDCRSADAIYRGLQELFKDYQSSTLDLHFSGALHTYCRASSVVSQYEGIYETRCGHAQQQRVEPGY